MKNPLFKVVVVIAGVVTGISLIMLLVFDSPGAAAQDTSDLWLSSMTPPEGISAEALSAPDQAQQPGNPDEAPEAIAAIISHRITGTALRPRDSVVNFDVNSSGGCIYAKDNAFDIFNTPIWLPQGATVNSVRMYYNDTAAGNSSAWFTIYNLYGEIVDEWSVSSTGSGGNGFTTSETIEHTVNYNLYSYLLNWRPVVSGTTMQLCGFRIYYEPPPFGLLFLPSIQGK